MRLLNRRRLTHSPATEFAPRLVGLYDHHYRIVWRRWEMMWSSGRCLERNRFFTEAEEKRGSNLNQSSELLV